MREWVGLAMPVPALFVIFGLFYPFRTLPKIPSRLTITDTAVETSVYIVWAAAAFTIFALGAGAFGLRRHERE